MVKPVPKVHPPSSPEISVVFSLSTKGVIHCSHLTIGWVTRVFTNSHLSQVGAN